MGFFLVCLSGWGLAWEVRSSSTLGREQGVVMAWSLTKIRGQGLRKGAASRSPQGRALQVKNRPGQVWADWFQLSFHSLSLSQDCVRAPSWTLLTQRNQVRRSGVRGEVLEQSAGQPDAAGQRQLMDGVDEQFICE